MHLSSQLGFALSYVAFFECDLGEEEGEFKLDFGGEGVLPVRLAGSRV